MSASQPMVDDSASLTGTNRFELLLFKLGTNTESGQSELYGINVLKVREIVTMPTVTAVAGSPRYSLGVVQLRDQVIPVFDLPAIVGSKLSAPPSLMLVTEFGRTTQAFTVESVDDIVRLDWNQVISAESTGTSQSLVSSMARLDGAGDNSRLAQVLDVEAILQKVTPEKDRHQVKEQEIGEKLSIRPGSIVLAADDSFVARSLLEQALKAMQLPFEMVKSGREAWDRLNALKSEADTEGKSIQDKVGLVLTDLEMPEMDGFTLTRNIKQDPRLRVLPVVIHSSLSGSANEDHVRSVGADGYVAKFSAAELAAALRKALPGKA
ncbi:MULTISPECIES: chemotaxis protein [unclassified Castellaniella]|jgi:two-component system chemotaxis response regulator CheV|uniref:chemotaxis protein n=1 Tax=unclassified Castellaniella TaxID=2617606 RepID=UPI003315E727